MRRHDQSFRFSTEHLSRSARAPAVLALRERGLLPIEPLSGRDVHVDIVRWQLPDLKILSGTLAGVSQHSTPQETRDELLVGLNLFGETTLTHNGRDVMPRGGDGFVVNVERGSVIVARPLRTQFIGFRVPHATLAPLTSGMCDGIRVIPRPMPTIRLLASYVRSLREGHALTSPEAQRLFAMRVHDLIALAMGPTSEAGLAATHRSVPAVRLHAIKSEILACLDDERLDVSAVAARQGITPRYVHRLFERDGLTYSQFVLGHRLDRAYRLLCDPRLAHRSISAIAYDVGFADLSYFNRTFRRRYQQTPTDVRMGHMQKMASARGACHRADR